jgi:hypothetical protein
VTRTREEVGGETGRGLHRWAGVFGLDPIGSDGQPRLRTDRVSIARINREARDMAGTKDLSEVDRNVVLADDELVFESDVEYHG